MNNYACWLNSIPGFGTRSIFKLRDRFIDIEGGDPAGFAEAMFRIPEAELSDICIGLKQGAMQLLLDARKDISVSGSAENVSRASLGFVSFDEQGFPERLKEIQNPPFALYYRGRLPDDTKPSVGIVGARMASQYGKEQARRFGDFFADNNVQVISGMARGVDGIAQRAAIGAGGASFAVLGCGADVCYPQENLDLYDEIPLRGGIISEYIPGTMAEARLFPMRNRIISGLSDAIILVEAKQRSGSLITCDYALDQGRDIYAVPGRISDALSYGCNHLIRQGAAIATCPDDVLEGIMGVRKTNEDRPFDIGEMKAMSLQEPEKTLYGLLCECDYCDTETLIMKASDKLHRKLEAAELMRCMLQLEMKELAIECAAGVYAKRQSSR